MKNRIFLLGAYRCVATALASMPEGPPSGCCVTIYSFRHDLTRFLAPVEAMGVSLQDIPPIPEPGLFRPTSWLRCRATCRTLTRRLFEPWREAEVYAYNTGFALAEICAVAALARQNTVLLDTSHDGRFTDTRMTSRAKGWKTKAYGRLVGWTCGAPVEMAAWTAPIPLLAESFLRAHCRFVDSEDRANTIERLRRTPWWHALARRTEAEVLWIHDDLPTYYGQELCTRSNFDAAMGALVAVARQFVPPERQAAKTHPGDEAPLPAFFHGMEELSRVTPSEFYDFPKVRAVIGSASCAMEPFLARPGVQVISTIRLLGARGKALDEGLNILKERVDPQRKVAIPATPSEFEAALRKALHHA